MEICNEDIVDARGRCDFMFFVLELHIRTEGSGGDYRPRVTAT